MSLLQRIKQHLLPPSSRSFHAFETNANSEMHQLRLENASLMQQLAYMSDQLTQITEQVNQIQAEHAYEQQRDMMLFWAEYQKPSESPIAAKKRFFRSLPKAKGNLQLLQDNQIKLFREFDSICRNNGIIYWVGSGTLLGAYLYEDIIPWDDDIDVFMTRSQIAQLQELLESDCTYRITTLWDWYVPCKQIRFCLQDTNNPAFIDLFPLDLTNSDPEYAWNRVLEERASFVKDIRNEFQGTEWESIPYLPTTHPITKNIERLYREHVASLHNDINYVSSFEDATGLTRGIENIDELHSTGPYPINDWIPTQDMKYRDFSVMACSAWNTYLTRHYGNYFKIPKDINSHEHVANDYLNSEAVQNSMHHYLGK